MMTTVNVQRGEFEVFWNGVKTGYRIINGSIGVSGRNTANIYVVVTPSGKYRWIGTLQAAKKTMNLTLTKIAKKIEEMENV